METGMSERRKQPSQRSDELDRLPPHSVEAEVCALGCVLLEPKTALLECADVLVHGGEEFYALQNRTIYEHCVVLGDQLALASLVARLRIAGVLDQVGGVAYVASLPGKVPSSANLPVYLDVIRDRYLRRRMIQVCAEGVAELYGPEAGEDLRSALEVTSSIEGRVLEVNREQNQAKTQPIREVVHEVINDVENHHRRGVGVITGIGTGFSFFDKMTGGLQLGEFTIIGGRPGSGKSAFVMNVAEFVAVDSRIPVWVGSAEMTSKALTFRMICTRAMLDGRQIKTGFMSERDFPKMTNAATKIAAAPMVIDDTSSPPIEVVRARVRRWAHEHRQAWKAKGFDEGEMKLLVVLDYAQKFTTNHRDYRRADERERYNHIAGEMLNLAKDENVALLVAAQLNRDSVKDRKKRKPRQEDLAEADGFCRDAHTIGLIWQPDMEEEEEVIAYRDKAFPTVIEIDKQRNGETGPCEFTFYKAFTRFEDKHREKPKEEMPGWEAGRE
jgi:replicative DNA helicase